ncbi:MAG: glycosyltransferase [Rhodobacteraceae bacterium]|nr:MAG: glycosyltransferase [Paracoccaceae bacterium]
MKIAIAAENASARFGGEAVLPLKYAQLLRNRGHAVSLITHARNRAGLQADAPDLAADAIFIPDTRLHRLIFRLGTPLPTILREHLFGNLLVLLTALAMRRQLRALVAAGQVEIIHQPIPVSPAAPSLIHGLGVPVVIGPMNGGMDYPPSYRHHDAKLGRVFLRLGRAMARGVNWLIPGKRRATILLVANARTRAALPVAHPQVIDLVENGVDFTLWAAPQAVAKADGFRLIFMGRLIPLKAVDVTLEALAIARAARPDLDIGLDILGDGPERACLAALAGDGVRFLGFLPQAECRDHLAASHALILNSLRECGGAVVLEAMALGLPVIASDWGGPADYVTPQTGFLVHPEPPQDFAARLADAILALARDPARAQAMGQAGLARVSEQFDWQAKIDRMEEIYAQALLAAQHSEARA